MFTVKQTNKQLQTAALVVKGTQWYRVPSSTENDLIMARQVGWFIFYDVSYFDRDCKAHIMSGQRVRFFFFSVLVGMYSADPLLRPVNWQLLWLNWYSEANRSFLDLPMASADLDFLFLQFLFQRFQQWGHIARLSRVWFKEAAVTSQNLLNPQRSSWLLWLSPDLPPQGADGGSAFPVPLQGLLAGPPTFFAL